MGWRVLLSLAILLQGATAQNPFSALLNVSCVAGQCGMGSCKQDQNSFLGFSCECQPGWMKLDPLNIFPFIPCFLPNCTIDFSCSNATGSPSPAPPPTNRPVSPFDPCSWSLCGEGDCVSTSSTTFNCRCRPGFSNLLNISSLPCVRECSLGADCQALQFTSPNSRSPPPPPLGAAGSRAASRSPGSSAWIIMIYSFLILALRA